MISYALLLLILISAAAAAVVGETPAYQATDLCLLNCGATSETQGPSGRTWIGDHDTKFLTLNSANASFSSTASAQDPSVPEVPYMTARIFRSEFTYSFPLSRGWKFVRLYFYPTRYGSNFDAVSSSFSVAVNGYSLLRNFSAHLTVTASIPESKSIIKEFIIPFVNDDQMLNLTFTPSLNSSAFVNGIEIVSMPDGLYTNGLFHGRTVGSSISFNLDNTTAFEMVYRLNVGGAAVADVNDTGMFRQWVPDFFYIPGAATGVTEYVRGVRIKYTQNTPAYVAPEAVYTSYRTMGNAENPRLNLNFNLTWILPVDAGFNYLVRLHFCETMKEVTRINQRVFSIFIRNRSVARDADVIEWSGGSGVPVFRDFIANVPYRGEERGNIRLDLHPYMDTKPQYADAILNGVEILKLNNTEGSLTRPVLSGLVSDDNLAGPLPPSSVSHSR